MLNFNKRMCFLKSFDALWQLLFLSSCFLLIFLNGCSTVSHKKDGPPPFYVDETKIPNAVPKKEPLSKYGNYNSYVVFGKRYRVLKTSRNYEERGIASWYGTKFHSRHTSGGERYNMLAMTAAHKSLPIPTYVQVTNLKNGKQVIVKVNDRGPFESNRLIDLSYVAAKKLGMIGHGTALVDVKSIDPRDNKFYDPVYAHNLKHIHHSIHPHDAILLANRESTHHVHHQSSSLFLQVGAFRDFKNAQKLKFRLNKMLASPVQITKRDLYHVRIGPIKDVASADRISQRLRAIGLKTR